MSESLDLSNIVAERVPARHYFREEFPKRQIYLSHSISHPHPRFVLERWQASPYKLGSCFLLAGQPYPHETHYDDGQIHQCFHSKYWAMHLGVHAQANQVPEAFKTKTHTRTLEKHSISIVLCSAGALSWEGGRFYTSFRKVVPEEQVIEYMDPYRGMRFFHRYTPAQIEALRKLLLYLREVYAIPLRYRSQIWDISEQALEGEPGLFTRCSVRSDVRSMHPQPELIEMLLNLPNS